jgi:hypothetical protein
MLRATCRHGTMVRNDYVNVRIQVASMRAWRLVSYMIPYLQERVSFDKVFPARPKCHDHKLVSPELPGNVGLRRETPRVLGSKRVTEHDR